MEHAQYKYQNIIIIYSEKTRLMGKRPVDAIKEKVINAKSSTFYSRPVGKKEKRLDSSVNVRYLFATGELEGWRETSH